ncbi:MAG: DUF1778 domain-containing protein [Candidatus Eremiobacteraeota bacterium]|nr:DUF1778 domain-containing protein [Candidatus Eremiobacteraeota bacterium]
MFAMKSTAKKTSKQSRLEARISEVLKQKLERAAAIRGLTLSSFVVRSMEQVAADVIREHEQRELSESAQLAFFEALLNPPEPNEKMIAAAKRYQES